MGESGLVSAPAELSRSSSCGIEHPGMVNSELYLLDLIPAVRWFY